MTRQTTSALVIGESGAGKTHYAAQLLGRLNRGRGRLAIDGVAADLSLFEEALQQLSRGLSAAHTPSGQFRHTVLPLADRLTGARLEVVWPDYAGEQVSGLVNNRDMPDDWRMRAESADAWILMVRLQHVSTPEDMLSRPAVVPRDRAPESAPTSRLQGAFGGGTEDADSTGGGAETTALPAEEAVPPFRWSDQARLVELLQLLLAARHTGMARALTQPRLVVLLSCWDEIGERSARDVTSVAADGQAPASASPTTVLAARAPLLAAFIEANWAPGACAVYGLSSTGRALRPDRQDDEYIDRGPEEFGYVVQPDGTRSSDLTLPLVGLASDAIDRRAAASRLQRVAGARAAAGSRGR